MILTQFLAEIYLQDEATLLLMMVFCLFETQHPLSLETADSKLSSTFVLN